MASTLATSAQQRSHTFTNIVLTGGRDFIPGVIDSHQNADLYVYGGGYFEKRVNVKANIYAQNFLTPADGAMCSDLIYVNDIKEKTAGHGLHLFNNTIIDGFLTLGFDGMYTPLSNDVLTYNGTEWIPLPGVSGPGGGDVSGNWSNVSVVRIQGRPVSAVAPSLSQVLQWNGSVWLPSTLSGTGTITTINTGTGLTGGPITSTGTISIGSTGVVPGTYGSGTQIATFTVNAQGQITSASNTGITPVTSSTPAGGDLSGLYPNPNVVRLQGNPVSAAAPSLSQVLQWNGTAWAPATGGGTITTINTGTGLTGGPITASGTISIGSTGVVAGTYGSGTQIATFTVNAQGQITSASNTGITPVTSSTPAGGDLSGFYPNPNVVQLQGNPVSAVVPSLSQVLQWNGTAWAPATGGGTITTINTGTGLTGGPITASGTISIGSTGVVAGTYGSGTQIATFTVNAQGQITSAANTGITPVTSSTPAGGDLSGFYPNPVLASVQSVPLSASFANNTLVIGSATSLGTSNVAFGVSALVNAASGSTNNTAVGYQAGSALVSGTSNTLVGSNASVTSAGANNVVLGANSGSNHSNTVIIGTGAVSTQSNEIVIGNGPMTQFTLGGGITAIPSLNMPCNYFAAKAGVKIGGFYCTNFHDAACLFVGSFIVTGSTLTVTSISFGALQIGMVISGGGVTPTDTYITSQLTGVIGGTGTYTINNSQLAGTSPNAGVVSTGEPDIVYMRTY